jgi:hypothetical protein
MLTTTCALAASGSTPLIMYITISIHSAVCRGFVSTSPAIDPHDRLTFRCVRYASDSEAENWLPSRSLHIA